MSFDIDASPYADQLTQAAIRYGSDKFGGHLYTPIYDELFSNRRDQPIRLLEIGIGGYDSAKSGGASLRMWNDYFPNGQIVGLDIAEKTLNISPRVHIVQGSQVDLDVLKYVCDRFGPFNIIIDDGSHQVPHTIATFTFLYPRMATDGIYVVEDTQTAFAPGAGGNTQATNTMFTVAHDIGLAMHSLEGYRDDEKPNFVYQFSEQTKSVSVYRNQIIFHRGRNTYPSNTNMSFDNEEVRKVFTRIEVESNKNFQPRNFVSRIDLLIWCKRLGQAADLAIEASNKYPSDVELHHELVRLMEWAGQINTKETIVERLRKMTQNKEII